MIGENTPHPVQPDDSTHEVKESSKFKLAPGRKATLHRKVEVCYLQAPITVSVTTANKKFLKTSGIWKGGSHTQCSNLLDQQAIDERGE